MIVSFYRNAARRWSPYGFRDRVSVPEIVLVGLAERLGIGWRHLPHVMTGRDQLAGYIVRAHTGFDADQSLAKRSLPAHLSQSNAMCTCLYRCQWCWRPQRLSSGTLLVLLVSFDAPSDSESRWGREHGRSIPFSDMYGVSHHGGQLNLLRAHFEKRPRQRCASDRPYDTAWYTPLSNLV